MASRITYYFTPVSPWTYLGHARLGEIAARHGVSVEYVPVTMSAIFPKTGGLPLAKRAPERQAYRMVELKRWPQRLGIPLNVEPKHFPADDRTAVRLALTAKAHGHDIAALTLGMLRACWVEERDIADPATLVEIAAACGLSGQELLEEAQGEAGQQRMEEACERALAAGCFGSPWYDLDGEPFWGQDRLDLLEHALKAGK
ncbi:2-hydroxychromene-2-carboxylate isomerase [Halomonas urumqiensis]|uniref:2-hydroxychromene-2-carboxylate isomerase n=1 Tax=Halomonas urumqiensis TaxID=1684789 RepID=A0A2N7UMJ7_9GAMM|nr:2-hydroxychromene-2-carboxylate isomerase [Halomonas urumqiensis]PMR81654.1 2-hydroxychromene-2-carboxylate isomerase [Halomonas urumqiensis]PTB02291.1 2-hydroxychromene-2-carboxylate isomerase [Halomonas urumqiensis]GHE21759.1 2-hydroxychromene-2-carboxylate isomerase [Halomonas urumqiensis]